MPRKGENIFKRKDGRWEGRFIKKHVCGKAIYGYVYGKSYKETKEKKKAAMSALPKFAEETKASNELPTFETVSSLWIERLKPIRKDSTIVKYQNQLDTHLLPAFGAMKIDSISNEDIIAFSNDLLSRKGLAPKTASDILSRIKSIRKYAIILGYPIKFQPECYTIPHSVEVIRVLSLSEEKILIKHLRSEQNLINLGILLCLFTGIRIGELCALEWRDISLSEHELHVRKTMQRLKNLNTETEKKTYISITEPKSKHSIRKVPIPDNIIDQLRHEHINEGYLLTGSSCKFIEPRTMENRFKAVLKKCGIEDANFHTLRHTYATRCIEAGVDVKALSEMLGHANVNITLNRYVHPTMQFKHENIKKLSGLFAVE